MALGADPSSEHVVFRDIETVIAMGEYGDIKQLRPKVRVLAAYDVALTDCLPVNHERVVANVGSYAARDRHG